MKIYRENKINYGFLANHNQNLRTIVLIETLTVVLIEYNINKNKLYSNNPKKLNVGNRDWIDISWKYFSIDCVIRTMGVKDIAKLRKIGVCLYARSAL